MAITPATEALKSRRSETRTQAWIRYCSSAIGIRTLLFVSLFFMAVIPISILSVWVARSALEKEIESVSEKHLIVAKNMAAALSRYVTDVKLVFGLLNQDNSLAQVEDGHEKALETLHLKYIVTLGARDEVLSKIKAGTTRNVRLPEKGLLDHLRSVAIAAGGSITVSGIKNFLGTPHFFVLRALPSKKLALAPLEPSYIVKIQRAINFGERGHAMIVDHRGRVVAHPNTEWQATSKNASKLSIVKKMIGGNTGVMEFYSPPMKADMIAGYTHVQETGWGVMVPQPMRELITRARDVQFATLTIAAVEILVAGLLSWWLASLLTRPVLAVVSAARKVSKGDLNSPVPNISGYTPFEMRDLSVTFNEMINDLKIYKFKLTRALIKAEDGSRTKSRFLSMMSHEIRTPMTGVIGALEVLDNTTLDDEQKMFVSVARNAGSGLMQIIDDILDFSKLEAGKLEVQAVPFDIRNTLVEVTQLFRPIVDKKSITLKSLISDDMPGIVVADPQRTRQILFNLVGNAVKFTDEGSVLIEATYAGSDTGNAALKISVRDTGIGIPDDLKDKLFNEFTQGDNTQALKYGGTGLGLAISKYLVESMGGAIGLDSRLGCGSFFWITIPVSINEKGM